MGTCFITYSISGIILLSGCVNTLRRNLYFIKFIYHAYPRAERNFENVYNIRSILPRRNNFGGVIQIVAKSDFNKILNPGKPAPIYREVSLSN